MFNLKKKTRKTLIIYDQFAPERQIFVEPSLSISIEFYFILFYFASFFRIINMQKPPRMNAEWPCVMVMIMSTIPKHNHELQWAVFFRLNSKKCSHCVTFLYGESMVAEDLKFVRQMLIASFWWFPNDFDLIIVHTSTNTKISFVMMLLAKQHVPEPVFSYVWILNGWSFKNLPSHESAITMKAGFYCGIGKK